MGKTIRMTTAQALVKFLNQQYISVDGKEFPFVEGVFNIFGHGNVLGIGHALEQDPGHLKVIQGKNEQGMAHAAIAFSKQQLRKKIYAVTASAGPGSANMVTAAATAHANNIPLLILPADTFATRQPDPVLQQLEHETSIATTTNDAFKAASRYWDRVQRPEQLMSALIRAFEVMTNPATAGPATICISQDTEGEAYDFEASFFEKRVHYLDRRVPTDREIEGAVARIKESKNPVIIVGGGAKYSQAGDILRQLSETHEIPLVETHAGKSTVAHSFENNLGGTGILGTSAANKAIDNADLIIGVGTRYTDFTTSSKTAFDYDRTKFLNINVGRMHAYKFDAFQVVGDAKVSLEMMAKELGNYRASFGSQLSEWKKEWEQERERLHNVTFNRTAFKPEIDGHFSQEVMNEYADSLNTEYTQTDAFITMNDTVEEGSIVVASAGSLPGDMQRLWETDTENTYHLEYGYSCMGYEVAGALGAKLAEPEREVYAVLGDGSFLMLHTELVTALQYKQKINVMLFDNSGYGCINNLQMSNGGGSYNCEFRDADHNIMAIDYAKVAEGYGAKTYRVTTRDELIAAIEDAKKQTVSTLIDIKVLPKTMTDGYGGWWNVGVSEVSETEAVVQAAQERAEKLQDAWKY
ncbi:3D-(3,5/4)-trihydroxycyclohexane-1,2-dione acylhydrolase (decyclizing) [Vagococcus lutrae]|uniref:3D-(3,5/4)-trihydroxycyclohexane-1,2-dione acylhydrolase (decyclizing) n=1 Tax=Vagococcus lutrae TaxID=81947 RepID=UPI002097B307|nr:3D-(3,5/4)-trihydroxycyclohexane-1,2-dione acylhydrolase (decyclizing) [Vagococcus lutrae]MCO7150690.1 3D-(3,5/4)-trihydroxycyclohexane-1,2-dione acylhydrolase (decyclizing) [Vagococcus lutrae]MDT2818992.1 3D-(3,5/4)-trihydroxycyclohexane-1,2-dione acylhydrolase (decyclizing) [Vagococcus lutrae]MDT2843882.1 3D-(3,5/4)-trihydroxycyclohexane-1,2-dione acylhydrolase (decyclizing) [Vagococcus lutrae]WCG05874.1 3D-(3,5/4)-trihydroxycyclohexane-1,2-dione acylhydrolase (decyclizing) [Vagococcus lut